jgi:membrane protease YdiL (CAAX protease family)
VRAGLRRALPLALAAAAAVAVWIATAGQPGLVRAWAVSVSVLLPLAAIKQVSMIGEPEALPRIPAYLSSIISLWILAGLTAGVFRLAGLGSAELRLVMMPPLPFLAWSVAPTAAGVAVLLLARRLGVRESALLLRLLPETPAEKQVFAGLSVTAGFCEELVFRGFLLYVLSQPFGTAGAIVFSSAVFGLSHAYQDARGAARAGLLGVLLALPPVLSGSLWPSIIAHTAIDLIGGLLLKDRLTGELA